MEDHRRVILKLVVPPTGTTPVAGLTNREAVEVMERLEWGFRWGELAPEVHFRVQIEEVLVGWGGIVEYGLS